MAAYAVEPAMRLNLSESGGFRPFSVGLELEIKREIVVLKLGGLSLNYREICRHRGSMLVESS